MDTLKNHTSQSLKHSSTPAIQTSTRNLQESHLNSALGNRMKRKALSSSSSSSKIGLWQCTLHKSSAAEWFLLSSRLEKAWSKKHQSLTILKKQTHNIGVIPKRWLKWWIYLRTPQPYSNRNHRQDPVHLGSCFYDTHFRTSEAIQPQTFNLLFQSVASCSSPKTAHFKYQHLQHLHLDSNTSPSYSSHSAVN